MAIKRVRKDCYTMGKPPIFISYTNFKSYKLYMLHCYCFKRKSKYLYTTSITYFFSLPKNSKNTLTLSSFPTHFNLWLNATLTKLSRLVQSLGGRVRGGTYCGLLSSWTLMVTLSFYGKNNGYMYLLCHKGDFQNGYKRSTDQSPLEGVAAGSPPNPDESGWGDGRFLWVT